MPSYPQCAAAAPCNDAHREMRPNGFTDYAPARASRLAPSASARGHASRARRHFINKGLQLVTVGIATRICNSYRLAPRHHDNEARDREEPRGRHGKLLINMGPGGEGWGPAFPELDCVSMSPS